MTKKTDVVNTPCYVLKNGNQTVHPTIKFDDPNRDYVCVYGFSGKATYDKFIKSAEQLLTPYPLANGYLSNRIAEADSANSAKLCLVILDATDRATPVVWATTMATVLLALQEKSKQVPVEFELVFDPDAACYQIKDSTAMPPIEPMSTVPG